MSAVPSCKSRDALIIGSRLPMTACKNPMYCCISDRSLGSSSMVPCDIASLFFLMVSLIKSCLSSISVWSVVLSLSFSYSFLMDLRSTTFPDSASTLFIGVLKSVTFSLPSVTAVFVSVPASCSSSSVSKRLPVPEIIS